MIEKQYQVTIHIVDRPLKFATPEEFAAYVEREQRQGGLDDVGQPVWKKFEHYPLLKIVDWTSTEEREAFTFKAEKDLPKETIKNVKGVPLLLIG